MRDRWNGSNLETPAWTTYLCSLLASVPTRAPLWLTITAYMLLAYEVRASAFKGKPLSFTTAFAFNSPECFTCGLSPAGTKLKLALGCD